MQRRKFLGSSFLIGALGGAAAGVAGSLALAPKFLRPEPLPGKFTYAQQGEDVALWQILRNVLGIEHPTYMDIGAHHPVFNNNTYLFYGRGARGVLVEPNPAQHRVLEQLRPRDVLVRAGIGVTAQAEADFYIIGGSPDGQLNTFSRELADTLVARSNGHYRIERVM